jgi:MFS family permease
LNNAYRFALFNALSFQIVLSTPMVLYAKSLNASATVVGIITGMMPMLAVLQIPAASHISRVGYKRFVFAGWGTRVMLIFVLALVPLSGGFLRADSRLALVLALLFGFNLSRGISSCAWLPWISSLVPAEIRGRYLARDAACVSLASSISFLVAGVCLGAEPKPWQFAVLFAFSGSMGVVSLVFLKRIPEGPMAEEYGGGKGPVPWGAMLRFPPFRKLLRVVLAWSAIYGAVNAFSVLYLKTTVGMSDNRILFATSVFYLGGLGSLWFLGSRLDGLGSKPVLTFAFAMWVVLLAGWGLLAAGAIRPGVLIVLGLQFFMGLFGALVTTSQTRLAMVVVPTMGRTHFLALFTVTGSVTLGISPIVWGIVIDALGRFQVVAGGLSLNRFSLFFVVGAVVMLVALAMARRLEEPQAAGLEELLRTVLIESPQRILVRLWPRG